ncbi:NUDIX hydrolase [Haloarcula regularis]|uniref:NUDIX hydrolase n=1 Tax=Haloarcula regularis TaxID=3033392 RepID=UPI0023E83F5D|nr:NUDIX domain-containing protein [Halomicroarcula sp. SYNS111]
MHDEPVDHPPRRRDSARVRTVPVPDRREGAGDVRGQSPAGPGTPRGRPAVLDAPRRRRPLPRGPEDGLVRELREELHCRAHVGTPRAQFCYVHESLASTVSLYTVFDCALLSDPTPARGEGIDDVGWFGPGTLPATTLPQVKHICRRVADLPAHRAVADD